jgi:hypothetical protein
MHAPALLAAAVLATTPAVPPEGPPPSPENLLAGPARCVIRYLDAVRLASPRTTEARGGRAVEAAARWAPARALTAPRTLEEIERRAARGEDHPLAPWRGASRPLVLDSFQLLAVRRAPRGAAVVTVRERFWRGDRDGPLVRSISEYLVGRVNGAWKVVDRRPGGAFDDASLAEGYAGFFDAAPAPR